MQNAVFAHFGPERMVVTDTVPIHIAKMQLQVSGGRDMLLERGNTGKRRGGCAAFWVCCVECWVCKEPQHVNSLSHLSIRATLFTSSSRLLHKILLTCSQWDGIFNNPAAYAGKIPPAEERLARAFGDWW